MNNIFKNAYFGKPYKTRDGRKALYQNVFMNRRVWAMVDKCPQMVPYTLSGKCEGDDCFDIISEWKEEIEINEEELDKLATTEANNNVGEWRYGSTDLPRWYGFKEGFKLCYSKLKGE